MTLLIDANILLDVLLDRQPHTHASSIVWKLCETGRVKGIVSALSFADIVYIMRKSLDPERVEMLLDSLSLIFSFEDLHAADLQKAASMRWNDFEDALQAVTAKRIHADRIVTRNTRDYAASPVPAVTPEELCEMMRD